MLTDARAALRTGDLALARRMLKRLTTDFAHGELLQEREVLQIELLSARGEDEAAARQARRFMSAHPDSPHSAQLARFLR
jgi:outer membrane protein assembly factor BamD (BamD/ComL family)